LRKIHGNASSIHTAGRRARGILDAARKSVAELLGCAPEQVIFTSGGTEANNTVIKGVFDAAGGGHIVTSKIEHESVMGACEQVEARGGRVTYLPARSDGRVDPEGVREAIRSETVLVSIMHANNETGVIQPVKEIAAVAVGAQDQRSEGRRSALLEGEHQVDAPQLRREAGKETPRRD
jgi:cysteine desulfurase